MLHNTAQNSLKIIILFFNNKTEFKNCEAVTIQELPDIVIIIMEYCVQFM